MGSDIWFWKCINISRIPTPEMKENNSVSIIGLKIKWGISFNEAPWYTISIQECFLLLLPLLWSWLLFFLLLLLYYLALPASPHYYLSVSLILWKPHWNKDSPHILMYLKVLWLLIVAISVHVGRVTSWRGCCRGKFKLQKGTGLNEILYKVPFGSKIPSNQ